MAHKIVFSPEAMENLNELQRYIEAQAGTTIAERYVSAIVETCEGLSSFPLVGTPKDDVRKGLRITHHKGRTIIAFSVNPKQVNILGVFYGGMDWESILAD